MPVIEVDFTGVTSGAGFLEPGTYRARVENVVRVDGRNYPGLKWTWTSVEPDTLGMQADHGANDDESRRADLVRLCQLGQVGDGADDAALLGRTAPRRHLRGGGGMSINIHVIPARAGIAGLIDAAVAASGLTSGTTKGTAR